MSDDLYDLRERARHAIASGDLNAAAATLVAVSTLVAALLPDELLPVESMADVVTADALLILLEGPVAWQELREVTTGQRVVLAADYMQELDGAAEAGFPLVSRSLLRCHRRPNLRAFLHREREKYRLRTFTEPFITFHFSQNASIGTLLASNHPCITCCRQLLCR